MDGYGIRVEGLNEFRRELKAINPKLAKEMANANKKVADLVASKAAGVARGTSTVSSAVAGSFKGQRLQKAAAVRFGGSKGPLQSAAGANFGAYKYKQFRPFKGENFGYIVGPAVDQNRVEIEQAYYAAIAAVAAAAFPS